MQAYTANQMGHKLYRMHSASGVYDSKPRLSLGLCPHGREVYSHKPLYTVTSSWGDIHVYMNMQWHLNTIKLNPAHNAHIAPPGSAITVSPVYPLKRAGHSLEDLFRALDSRETSPNVQQTQVISNLIAVLE